MVAIRPQVSMAVPIIDSHSTRFSKRVILGTTPSPPATPCFLGIVTLQPELVEDLR